MALDAHAVVELEIDEMRRSLLRLPKPSADLARLATSARSPDLNPSEVLEFKDAISTVVSKLEDTRDGPV